MTTRRPRSAAPSASALADATLTSARAARSTTSPVAHDARRRRSSRSAASRCIDRGRAALFPILDELVAAKDKHKLLLCCGGGTRARHIYAIASDLELPTGVLAALGGYVPRQNARMLQMLLAKHGGLFIMHDDFEKLPLYFRLGCIPIMTGMPPFGYWEKPTRGRAHPAAPHRRRRVPHRRGARRASARIFIKDEDGLYTDDPKKNPAATHIPRIGAQELLARDLPDLVVERVVIEYLTRARFCHELQIVNGLERGHGHARARGRGCRHDHLQGLAVRRPAQPVGVALLALALVRAARASAGGARHASR